MEDSTLPRRALAHDDLDETPYPVNFVPGRRWAVPPPDESDDSDTTTPVPPPAPILPTSERVAAAGRRFSADEFEQVAQPPRRSASSPTPYRLSPDDDTLPGTDGTETSPSGATAHPFHVRWFWPVVAVAVIAAILLGITLIPRLLKPAVPGGALMDKANLLSQPADMEAFKAGTSWTATSDVTPNEEDKAIRCVLPSTKLSTLPLEGSVVRRTLTTTTGDATTVVEQVETYADKDTASGAFGLRSAQLGGCAVTPDLVTKGLTVGGLGDQSVAVQVSEQDAAAVAHTLLLVRTGQTLLIVDARAGSTPPAADALAKAVIPALKRLCGTASGTCPTTPTVADADVPPPGETPGALAVGDLPRVTAGTGAWVAAEVKPMKLSGSGCEGVDLTAPGHVTSAVQHTYLLTGDSAAPKSFGVDEVVYTFAAEADAKAFVDTVSANITDCPKTQNTANVTAAGQLAAPASGNLFTVDQRQTINKAARSQVFVSYSGTRAVYFAAYPTPEFDLKTATWLWVGQRAISRAKQQP